MDALEELKGKNLNMASMFVILTNGHDYTQAMLKVVLKNQAKILSKQENVSEDELWVSFTEQINETYEKYKKTTIETINDLAK